MVTKLNGLSAKNSTAYTYQNVMGKTMDTQLQQSNKTCMRYMSTMTMPININSLNHKQ